MSVETSRELVDVNRESVEVNRESVCPRPVFRLLTVPSFAHQRNSIRANSTVVADEINSANDYPVATLSICVDLEAEIAAKK